jgi:predicted alpha/beta-hydrolase family hydrolase
VSGVGGGTESTSSSERVWSFAHDGTEDVRYAVPSGHQRHQPIKRPKLGPWASSTPFWKKADKLKVLARARCD